MVKDSGIDFAKLKSIERVQRRYNKIESAIWPVGVRQVYICQGVNSE